MKKLLCVLFVALTLALFGCVSNSPVCGDGKCAAEEIVSCPADCNPANTGSELSTQECLLQSQIEALKLKSAVEQAVSGEVSQVEFNFSSCANNYFKIETVANAEQCQADCKIAAAECLEIRYAQNKAICVENAPAYVTFPLESPCEPVTNTALADFRKGIPSGKFILTNESQADEPAPKLCAYKNKGLSAEQIQQTFVPARMKWIAEQAKQEAIQTMQEKMENAIDSWYNNSANSVVLPAGSEGKTWAETLDLYASITFAPTAVTSEFKHQMEGIVPAGPQGDGYALGIKAATNENFTVTSKIVAPENCGSKNPSACANYYIEYSFPNSAAGPTIVVTKQGTTREYETLIFTEPLKVYSTSNFVQQLAELAAASQ